MCLSQCYCTEVWVIYVGKGIKVESMWSRWDGYGKYMALHLRVRNTEVKEW